MKRKFVIPIIFMAAMALCSINANAEASILEHSEWISLPGQDLSESAPSPYLRRSFELEKTVKEAKILVTARGIYELTINGRAVTDAQFLPGWTDYHTRIYCHQFDVLDLVRSGENVIGAKLGDGWYAGYLGWQDARQIYGEVTALLLELKLTFDDGSVRILTSDDQWKASEGPIRMSDFYNGEDYDARMEMPGWDQPGFDDHSWVKVATEVQKEGDAILEFAQHAPVKEMEILHPLEMWQTDSGSWVFDLGQNMVGKARVTVPSEADLKVTIRFAEMLQKDRTLYTESYRTARSIDSYICKGGEGFETWEPSFTFHGFRYVELVGLPKDVTPAKDWVEGKVLHSELNRIGTFECSNPDLNQLQSNIVWGQKGNFLEVPTDCPQRDERLGWTGDTQVFCPTACFNFDSLSFFKKWMVDMRDAQRDDGAFPHVAPNVLGDGDYDSPGWADAGVIVPWQVYIRYGDQSILEENYESMMGWIEYQIANSPEFIRKETGFGDWLQPYPSEENGNRGDTSKSVIGTAHFAYTASLISQIAKVLGNPTDAERMSKLSDRVKEAFFEKFWTAENKLTSHTQTAYLMALAFDLLPQVKRDVAFAHLLSLIDEADGHLRTGFIGTPLLPTVLTRFGRTDIAYRILLKETYPGWIFSIRQGATTMWERWNSYSHEHGFGDAGMNSFNHYSYGAVGQWMYETIAGLKPDETQPGYQHFWIEPQPGGGLTWAKAEIGSQYGKAGSQWRIEGSSIVMIATVPEGSEATVVIPENYRNQVLFQGHPIDLKEDGSILVESGTHTFIGSM